MIARDASVPGAAPPSTPWPRRHVATTREEVEGSWERDVGLHLRDVEDVALVP